MLSKYKYVIILSLGISTMISCQVKKDKFVSSKKDVTRNTFFVDSKGDTVYRVILPDDEWKKLLNEKEYYVMREKGTERAFTGDLLENKRSGTYTCRGCGHPLFSSKTKFNSGTGWPSFFDVVDQTAVHKETDYDIGYPRTELTCAKCGGHLGHVFEDGPRPTGLRYCINAVSLDFVEEKK